VLTIPTIIEKIGNQERYFNIFDKLLKDRIVLLNHEVDEDSASVVMSSLMYLDSESNEEITLFIQSPGGSVYAGLSIFDTMNRIKSPVKTVCTGMAASMGAFLLSSGAKGKRFATKSSRIMMHSVSSGAQGTYHDLKIDMKETEFLQNYLTETIAQNTGQKVSKLKKDMQRDYWMSAEEAMKYGVIDGVI
jgi:ATP-dependent Clp protease protease subunit